MQKDAIPAVQHSAQHLISGIIFNETGFNTVSMHIGSEESTIDIAAPFLSEEIISKTEETAMCAIEENVPFIIHVCPPENINDFPIRRDPPKNKEIIRLVEIKNYDLTPCSGDHCSSSGEIGIVRILNAEKYKGMTRLHFIAGKRVFDHHRMLYANASQISRSLSVPLNETAKGTIALLEKANTFEFKIKEAEEISAKAKAALLIKEGKSPVIECYASETADELLRIGKAAAKMSDALFILASEKELQFTGICSAKDSDIKKLISGTFSRAEGKGGGNASFFQGKFASKENLFLFLEELKKEIMH